MLYGTVTASATWTFGLPFLLIGSAIVVDRSFPRWIGVLMAVAGTGSAVGGVVTYLDWHPSSGFVVALACNAISTAFLAVLGAVMWRQAKRL
ncbi:hypothetical protein [Nocardia brasiliensis]|uniref:hypothetical protein n=1 Tax=Nocardia brasiliensis TaxID=37326 RepID=UPI0034581443